MKITGETREASCENSYVDFPNLQEVFQSKFHDVR